MLVQPSLSVLKINGSLTRPFSVSRGIRQGCALSGLLYTIAIELLLVKLRARLSGILAPGIPEVIPVSLTAYADDVTVFLKSQEDMQALSQCIQAYQEASSARINWGKCSSFLLGEWLESTPPRLPQPCSWNKEGFKFLGVYLGKEEYRNKNWEGLEVKVLGRLHLWEWILSQLSYRDRVLVVNNLAASMLWHRVAVLDPPVSLVGSLQKAFVNFFWDGHHWLPPGVLYLLLAEGGQGLILIASKVASLRLQAAQHLLHSTETVSWVPFACSILHCIGNLCLDRHLFLMSSKWLEQFPLPLFYASVFSAWGFLNITREKDNHYGVEEPLFLKTHS